MTTPLPSGAEVARLFHAEAVAPLLTRAFPRLRYAAGRLGSGSDVLGLDDARSRDHDWGCRLTLLVDEPDADAVPRISAMLERELPQAFRGMPVRFGVTWDTAPTHNVDVATVGAFAASRLGVPGDAARALFPGQWSPLDWLTVTGQDVLEVTAGPVFADGTTALGPLRAALEWYPPEVERYALAAGWRHLAQELPLLGRTADRGLHRAAARAEGRGDILAPGGPARRGRDGRPEERGPVRGEVPGDVRPVRLVMPPRRSPLCLPGIARAREAFHV